VDRLDGLGGTSCGSNWMSGLPLALIFKIYFIGIW
jgi:hypothetical protein